MKKFTKMKVFRTIVQLLFFIIFPGLVGSAFLEIKTLFTDIFSGNFVYIFADCSLFLVLAILTIFTGRFFCGWMCMFGSYNDWVNLFGRKVLKINFKINETADKYMKYIKYVVLIFIACFIWTSLITIPDGASPWDAIMQLTDPGYAFSNYLIGIIILVLITIGDLFVERFFCRYLCPLGAVFSILSKIRLINIRKNRSNCGPCKACTLKCSMGIDLDSMDVVKSGECIQCFNCVAICPKQNANVMLNKRIANEYAVASIAVAGTTGAYLGMDAIANAYLPSSYSAEQVASSKYADGTYIGTGTGYRPNLKLSVTIKNGKITDIEVYSSNETQNFFSKAWTTVKNKIISSQSTNVDTVSGATKSSNGIIAAVNDALQQAMDAKNSQTTNTISNTTNITNTVSNTTSNNTTAKTNTTSTNTSNTSTSTVTNTNTSTATTSSTKKYNDGTYVGTGTGYRPNLKIAVTISGGEITDIEVQSSNETESFFSKAWSTIKSKIISSQSTNVNTVSGATKSSNGIISAVNDALKQAAV